MTDNEYLERMYALTKELDRIANHEPLVPDEWDSTMDEMHRLTCDWHVRRRCIPWFFPILCWFLLGILACLLLMYLFN